MFMEAPSGSRRIADAQAMRVTNPELRGMVINRPGMMLQPDAALRPKRGVAILPTNWTFTAELRRSEKRFEDMYREAMRAVERLLDGGSIKKDKSPRISWKAGDHFIKKLHPKKIQGLLHPRHDV